MKNEIRGAVPAQAPPALHRKYFTGVTRSNCSENNHILLLEVPPSFTLAVSFGCVGMGRTPQTCPRWGGWINSLVQKGHVEAQSTQITSSSLPVISLLVKWFHFQSRRSQDFRGCPQWFAADGGQDFDGRQSTAYSCTSIYFVSGIFILYPFPFNVRLLKTIKWCRLFSQWELQIGLRQLCLIYIFQSGEEVD